MVWLIRGLCFLYFLGFLLYYLGSISLKLPLSAAILLLLSLWRPAVGLLFFICFYPIILFLNQYPEHQFSAATLLTVALVLGCATRTQGIKKWQWVLPLAVLGFYWLFDVVRIRPRPSALLANLFSTNQTDPLVFAGVTGMWAAGVLFFLSLKSFLSSRTRFLYFSLLIQGVIFAGMCLANIWVEKKSPLVYYFLFGDRNTFAAYWVLQIGLLAGLWALWPGRLRVITYALFCLYSLLLIASLSLSGIFAYVVLAILFAAIVVDKKLLSVFTLDFYRRNWGRMLAAFLVLYFFFPTLALVYPPSDPIAVAEALGERIRTASPGKVGNYLYEIRALPWAIAWEMVKEHPVFGVGLGRFPLMYGEYRKRVNLTGVQFDYPQENAHNYYLQIAAETGVLGLALFAGFLGWLLWKHWDFKDPIKASCGMAVVGLMVFSLAQHPLLVDRLFFVFVIICALMTCPEKASPPEASAGAQHNLRL